MFRQLAATIMTTRKQQSEDLYCLKLSPGHWLSVSIHVLFLGATSQNAMSTNVVIRIFEIALKPDSEQHPKFVL